MTILLFDDGRLLIDKANPIEANLDGLVMMLDGKAGDVLAFDGNIWQSTAPAPVLYVGETETAAHETVLTENYSTIAAAVAANKAVYVKTESGGTVALAPLATYGGNDDDGYTVTAGSDTYTSETAEGNLVKGE